MARIRKSRGRVLIASVLLALTLGALAVEPAETLAGSCTTGDHFKTIRLV